MDHAAVLNRVVQWARDNPNVRTLVLTGSLARGDGLADPLSDLDVELYVADPAPLLEHTAWYEQFGDVLVVEALPNEGWNPTRLVNYVGGKIDFTILRTHLLQREVTYERPFRLLLDKDGIAGQLKRTSVVSKPPTEEEFRERVEQFFAECLMCAKAITRNEPWMAKVRDWNLKTALLQMIEWDHKARYGWEYDTWHLGVHLQQWMDAEFVEALHGCWSGFSAIEMQEGLHRSIGLFEKLRVRTGLALGFPDFRSKRVITEIEHIRDGQGGTAPPSDLGRELGGV